MAPERRADGSAEAVAHRAEAAARTEGAGLLDGVVLRRPHLMLADVGDDDGIVLCDLGSADDDFMPEL